jgi:hypothetical protein
MRFKGELVIKYDALYLEAGGTTTGFQYRYYAKMDNPVVRSAQYLRLTARER